MFCDGDPVIISVNVCLTLKSSPSDARDAAANWAIIGLDNGLSLENELEKNVGCKISVILSRSQCVHLKCDHNLKLPCAQMSNSSLGQEWTLLVLPH